GYTLDMFFDDFPTVSRDEVLTVLDFSRQCVEASGREHAEVFPPDLAGALAESDASFQEAAHASDRLAGSPR
ncbi:MAG: hypothetical protein ACRDGS_04590, partial [Chloroflexota bacterium]